MSRETKAQAPVVVLEQAGRSFGPRAALAPVSLSVRGGEVLGVVGPNGGGKSTLLLLMAGLLRPTSGRVTVDGVDAFELSLSRSGSVGLVTARPGLYPLLTARENLRYFGGLFGLTDAQVDERAAPLLATLALSSGLDEQAGRLSTGMQQKLSLVRALLLSPRVLLLDEPTANLDPLAAQALYAEVRRRADEGMACVLVTHDLPHAEALCDRVLLVDGGLKRELTFPEHRAPLTGPLLAAWKKELGRP